MINRPHIATLLSSKQRMQSSKRRKENTITKNTNTKTPPKLRRLYRYQPLPYYTKLVPNVWHRKRNHSNNMGNGTSKESSKKEERKGIGRDIFLRIDEAVGRYFVDERRNGGEFERRGTRNGRGYREPTPSPREGMSPDAWEKIERWLEGCGGLDVMGICRVGVVRKRIEIGGRCGWGC
jgi:hypothetical protein